MADHQAEPKLTVYRGWPTQGNHVWSPFVVKLEAQLRFTGIAYKAAAGSPMEAPKGKIPYVEMPVMPTKVDGTMTTTEKMGDSTLIIKHLVGAGSLPDLNAQLSPEGKAADLATRALLEDKLYFFHVSLCTTYITRTGKTRTVYRCDWPLRTTNKSRKRWIENYYTMRDHVLLSLPPLASESPGGPDGGLPVHQGHALRPGDVAAHKERSPRFETGGMADDQRCIGVLSVKE